jgi:hypothetical protein
LAVGLLAGIIALFCWSRPTGAVAVVAAATPYNVTVAQTSGLTDGTPVAVTVTSSDPSADPVGWVDIRICRPGIDYTSYAVVETRGNCGFSPGSSAYTSPTGSATQDFPGQPSGAASFPDTFIAGVGSAQFAGFSLTCDATHACDLVVSVFTSQTQSQGLTAQDVQSFPLTFLPFGHEAGCASTAADAIETVSSDRLVQSYTDWSQQACSSGGVGGGKAITVNTFLNEGGPFGAVDSFANGSADMAYAAGGYDLPGFSEPTGRPYVAVPVALNAVVVAASGGQQVPAFTPKGAPAVTASAPFGHLALTAGQAASIFGGGYVSARQTKAIDRENPELQAGAQIVPYTAPGGSNFVYPQAVAGVSATTVFASTYLTDVAGQSWTSGPYARSGQRANVRRGVISSFALPGVKEPAFNSLGLYSHRTDLERAALPFAGLGPLPLWVLTDRATATQLGFAVASLGPSPATTVDPTKATMDAAVATMRAEPDGTLGPDPARAGKTAGYPLTFVEYALVPTEPLVDASCHPRTESEQLMIKWLRFVTGPGQSKMAPGLEPLTAALRARAASALAQVGRAKPTGACGPKVTTPVTAVTTTPPPPPVSPPSRASPVVTTAPPTSAAAAPSAGGSSTAGSSTAAAPTAVAPGTKGAPATTVAPSSPAAGPAAGAGSSTGRQQLAAVRIPRLTTRNQSGWVLPSIGLLVVGLLTGGVALRTSGRTWRPRRRR